MSSNFIIYSCYGYTPKNMEGLFKNITVLKGFIVCLEDKYGNHDYLICPSKKINESK